MEFLKQQYAVVAQFRSNSNTGTGRMTTITFRGVTDNKEYTSYIVDKFRNAKQWQPITNNPHTGHLVKFESGRLSKAYQIDADSVPTVVTTASTAQLNSIINEIHGIKPVRKKPTKQELLEQIEKTRLMVEDLFSE